MCTYLLDNLFQVFGHVDVGLLTVTIPESDDVNFCVKYYTQLYNISNNATTATRYTISNRNHNSDYPESTKQMEVKLNFQVPTEGLELVIFLHKYTVLSFEAS